MWFCHIISLSFNAKEYLMKISKVCLIVIGITLILSSYGCQTGVVSPSTPAVTKYTTYLKLTLGMTAAEVLAITGTPQTSAAIVSGKCAGGTAMSWSNTAGTEFIILQISSSNKLVKIAYTNSVLNTTYTIEGIYTTQTGSSALATLGTESYKDTSSPLEIDYYYSSRNVMLGISKLTDKVYTLAVYDSSFWGY